MEQTKRGCSSKRAGKGARVVRIVGAALTLNLAFLAAPASAAPDKAVCDTKRRIFTANETAPSLARKLARHEPVLILAIGSSSTEGVGASSPDHSYPALLEDELNESWKDGVVVVNAGRGGETAAQTIDRLEAVLKNQSFDLVIWQVGTNDAIRGVDEDAFRALLERGISTVKAAGTSLILLDQQYFPSIRDMSRYERFVQAVGTLGQERKVSVFSRYALMQDWSSRSAEDLRSMLSADGFHMSDKGYDCLADHVADAIQTLAQQPVAQSGGTGATQLATAR